ncbi:glutathione S-transferase family protein [Agrobacterium tumefaciens]|uniref:glutathione S-transferase family protein n=1 Tax=Agrobacterium tumefaciens TaxID=358 RepID=UPI001F289C8F|nr:glutathione S-transferase family protein [Agrobacterium tumefaciens]WCK74345.1 glutathione S-transferase family protein [Agrobacterium tumefaciens]WIE41476.1 glutathione S-transferase family protein [Agrobacterium tumefaciens]
MDHELYWISGSPYSWRVQIVLEYKKVRYTSRRLDTGKRENRSPEFLALNPRGKAPVLKTGDTSLCESVAIIAFLDRAYPAVPLFGKTAESHGRIWQRVCEFENYARDVIETDMVRPLLRGDAGENPEQIRASVRGVQEALGWLDRDLSRAPYLAGDEITAADFIAMPHLQLLRRVATGPTAIELAPGLDMLNRQFPALSAWLARIEAMPCYVASYPPHWKSS